MSHHTITYKEERPPEIEEELTPVMSNMSDDLARLLFEPKSAKRAANEDVPFTTSLRTTGTSVASVRRREHEPTGTYEPPRLKRVEVQKETEPGKEQEESSAFIKDISLRPVKRPQPMDANMDFDAACSDFESTHAEMTQPSIQEQELEERDKDTSKLEQIEKILMTRRGSQPLLDETPEFEALKLRPVQRVKQEAPAEPNVLETLTLKKVERVVPENTPDKEIPDDDNASDTSSNSCRLEAIERQLAARRGSMSLLDEPPEFESLTLRRVKNEERAKQNSQSEADAIFEQKKLKHIEKDSIQKDKTEEPSELFDKFRSREGKAPITEGKMNNKMK